MQINKNIFLSSYYCGLARLPGIGIYSASSGQPAILLYFPGEQIYSNQNLPGQNRFHTGDQLVQL